MKKEIKILGTALFVVLAASCSGEANQSNKSDIERTEIEVFQFKVEIVDQLDAFVEKFEAAYPQYKIVMDTVGGGSSYGDALRQRVNSGEEPAIFNIGGQQELTDWFEYVEDLSDQPWVSRALASSLDNITRNGKVYGLPYGLEGYGLIYNATILEQAGYTKEQLNEINTLEEMRTLFADIDSQKEALGIDTVLSFSLGGTAWWTASIHNFNVPWAYQKDPFALIEAVKNGTESLVGNKIFEDWLNFLDLLIDYSYDNLTTVEYNDQVSNFAIGKTAFLHQGNWTIGMLNELDDTLDMGILPFTLGGEEYNAIPVGVPNYWAVNKNKSEAEKAGAKAFLDYMVSSEEGHDFLVNEALFIPAFGGIDVTSADPLAREVSRYSAEGRAIPWIWFAFPNGYQNQPTSEILKLMQTYYQEGRNKEAFLQEATDTLVKLAEQQQ